MQNLIALDWNEILEKIRSYATSGSAKTRILEIGPLANPTLAQLSFQEITEAAELLAEGVRPYMQSLDLFPIWYPRLKKKAMLKTLEIKDVRDFCLEAVALQEALSTHNTHWSKKISSQLIAGGESLSAIDQILAPNGEIRSDASEKLYNLFREKEKLAREVQTSLDRLVKDHQMENSLQDKYVTTREGRWVLPVRGGMQHYVPGVIHGSSQSKQTVFIEPEKIIPLNNRLRQIEVDIEDEVERLLIELSNYLSSQAEDFHRSFGLLEEADIRLAQAQFKSMINGASVEFAVGPAADSFELIEVRHPLLQLSGKFIVANTVLLNSKKSILLLSGPNAGGKTVLLKSIGLAAQMARCGLPICASESSRIPFFKDILIGIGDAQSVDEELSTFAAHLKILTKATQMKGSDHLVLIDEICGSTDPEEGSALGRSFIEAFSKNNVYAVITSHLGPLKSGWTDQDHVLNGCLEYNSKSGRPTYQFLSGIPGDSLAIQTAKRVGVSNEIVERAIEVLSPTSRIRLQGLEQIEQLKSDIALLQEHLHSETKKATATKNKYESLLNQFNKEKEASLTKTLKKAEKKVDEAIGLAKAGDIFARHRNLQDIKYKLPEIVKAQPISTGSINSAEDFTKKFPTGSKVFIPSLNQDGIIQSAPNSKGEVMTLSNSIRLLLSWQELRSPEKPQNPTALLVRKNSAFTVALNDSETILDLRGKTVEAALDDLEVALDKAAHIHEDRLKIIHGHGTEALKKSIRTYLSRSIYVKKWKAGAPETGGDGITWVELNLE